MSGLTTGSICSWCLSGHHNNCWNDFGPPRWKRPSSCECPICQKEREKENEEATLS